MDVVLGEGELDEQIILLDLRKVPEMTRLKTVISRFVSPRLIEIYRRTWKRDRSSRLTIKSCGAFQVAYRQGTADERVIEAIFEIEPFFSCVPEYKPSEHDVIIDVGAHIGTFALLASQRARHGKVYAVEACQESFDLLRINVALNHAANISVRHLALTDRRGQCALHYDAGTWGHSVVKPLSKRNEMVESCSLADFMQDNAIDRCDFMKLNCEGAEFPILLGSSRDTLGKFSTIVVCYHCDLWTNNTAEDLVAHLQAGGFRCRLANRTENRGWIIATGEGCSVTTPA